MNEVQRITTQAVNDLALGACGTKTAARHQLEAAHAVEGARLALLECERAYADASKSRGDAERMFTFLPFNTSASDKSNARVVVGSAFDRERAAEVAVAQARSQLTATADQHRVRAPAELSVGVREAANLIYDLVYVVSPSSRVYIFEILTNLQYLCDNAAVAGTGAGANLMANIYVAVVDLHTKVLYTGSPGVPAQQRKLGVENYESLLNLARTKPAEAPFEAMLARYFWNDTLGKPVIVSNMAAADLLGAFHSFLAQQPNAEAHARARDRLALFLLHCVPTQGDLEDPAFKIPADRLLELAIQPARIAALVKMYTDMAAFPEYLHCVVRSQGWVRRMDEGRLPHCHPDDPMYPTQANRSKYVSWAKSANPLKSMDALAVFNTTLRGTAARTIARHDHQLHPPAARRGTSKLKRRSGDSDDDDDDDDEVLKRGREGSAAMMASTQYGGLDTPRPTVWQRPAPPTASASVYASPQLEFQMKEDMQM